MKKFQIPGVIVYSLIGFFFGVIFILVGGAVTYNNGFKGPWFTIFEYAPNFVLVAFSPIYLGLLFCFIGFKRDQFALFIQELKQSLSNQQRVSSATSYQNKLFSNVLAQVNEGIIIFDNKGNIQWVNDGFTNITGYTFPEVKGKDLADILDGPLTDKIVPIRMMDKLHAGHAVVEEIPIHHKKGQMMWISLSIKPIFKEEGQIINFIAIQNDITQSKLSAIALKKSEEEKAIVLNNTQTIICLHDMSGAILDVNPAVEKSSGFTKKEITGRNLKSIISPEFHPQFDEYIHAINNNETASGTMQIITRAGNKRVWLYQNTVYKSQGSVPYVIASAVDITESVKARNEIEKQQQFVRQIIDNSPNVIFVLDEEGKIILANKTFADYYTLDGNAAPLAATISSGPEDIFLGDVKSIFEMENGQVIRWEGSQKNITTGEISWFNIINKCFEEKNGKKYVLVYGMDMTSRHKVQTELIAANVLVERSLKVKDQFISNMSHEIRTPLNAVIGFTDLLSETSLDKEQLEFVEIVKTASSNLLSLINNILDLSKIESKSLDLENLPIDISKIVKDVVKILESKANTKGLFVNYHFDCQESYMVVGDQLRLTQVMFNLLGNAIKFTDEGSVDIICKRIAGPDETKDYIAFSIKDTGIGVPRDKQAEIFERFTQANTNTQRLYGGTGLGLNITKSIIDLYGGRLSIESEPDLGTTFHFIIPFNKYVPLADANNFAKNNAESIFLKHANKPAHILLAEDNAINAMLATQVLTRKGFTLEHVVNGELAVEAIQQKHFDLILMDIQMPVMNGIQASIAIRQLNENFAAIPIIAMTAHSLQGEMQNCFNSGMNGYIAKPFKPNDLFNTIYQVLNDASKNDLPNINNLKVPETI